MDDESGFERAVKSFEFRSVSLAVKIIALPIITVVLVLLWFVGTSVALPIHLANSVIAMLWMIKEVWRRNL